MAFESTTKTTSTSTFKRMKVSRSEELMFPLRELVLIDYARDFRHISWTKKYPGAAFESVMSFLQRSCSSICGCRSSQHAVSDSSCLACRNYCLSNVTFTWGENLHPVISMLSHSVSSSGAGPGSLSVTKMSCASCLATLGLEKTLIGTCSSSPTSPHGSPSAYSRTRSCFQVKCLQLSFLWICPSFLLYCRVWNIHI